MIYSSDCWDTNTHNEVSHYASRFLWRFIQHNARESIADEIVANLTRLTKRDIRLLSDIRFLLSEDVKILLTDIAPKIVSRLSKASIMEKVTERAKIRGRIDWPRTYGARAAAGGDVSLYVYAKKSQIFDLPENRLFLYIIQQIHNMARSISVEDYSSLTWYSEYSEGDKWINRISLIAAQTAKFLRNPYIARIGRLHELSDKIIEQTKHVRAPYYRYLADIAELYLFSQDTPIAFLDHALKGNILEPLNWDTLFEIAVLFKVIGIALDCGWVETRSGLIGGSSKTVCTLVNNDCLLNVYYQKIPELFIENSRYGEIMNTYGLSEKLRRPDIVLSFEKNGKKAYYIIEVKRSMRRSYLVDGAYKLLGYLKDFESVLGRNESLRGFLVGWKGIREMPYDKNKEVQIFCWNNINDSFEGLLECHAK